MFDGQRTIKILLLGQCFQYGYTGVDRSSTYISLAVSNLETRFKHLKIRLDLKHLYHPIGLEALLKHRLPITRPDITVLSVGGAFTAQCRRVNLLYELAPELVDTARSFVQKVEARLSGSSVVSSQTALDPLMAWHPPLKMDTYERLIREGIALCRAGGSRPVILGPTLFNDDSTEAFDVSAPDLTWKATDEMVRRVAGSLHTPVIDAPALLAGHGGEVFLPNSIRWSNLGHEIVSREAERILANEILMTDSSAPNLAPASPAF